MFVKEKQVLILLRVRGRRRSYTAKIEYPTDFPLREPRAFTVDPMIEDTPHQFPGGRLCLHSGSEVGPQTTGKVICDWTLQWYDIYKTKWLASGKTEWPDTNR